MSSVFLTVYTPTFRRPRLLDECRASVEAQTLPVQHLVIRDEVGIGIEGVFADIPNHVGEIEGEYVFFLQDDNVFADERVVAELREHVEGTEWPDVVIFKLLHVDRVLPDFWGLEPQLGHIDLSNFVVRRNVWVEHRHSWGRRYEGDFDFIRALWEECDFAWWDRLAVTAAQIGRGLPE